MKSPCILTFRRYMNRLVILNFLLVLVSLKSMALDVPIVFRTPASNKKVERSLNISNWESIKVQKGFILSNDLYYSRLCSKTWSYQIPEFKKKNPQVKDVNKFWPGDEITIQNCQDYNAAHAEPPVLVEEPKKTEPVAKVEEAAKPVVEETPAFVEKTPEEESDLMIMVGLGFLSERYDPDNVKETSLRYGIKKDLYPRVGYKLTMDFTSSVIFASNKIQVKTAPDKRQYYASFGIGNRLGLVKKTEIKLTDSLTSYSALGAGMLYNYRGIDFDIELGTTLNSSPGVNFSVTGVKKISDNFSLGAYFDLLSTDPKVSDSSRQRNLITGGAIILF